MEKGMQPVNNEVESFVGELRQLREREVKFAKILNACEELLDRGMENGLDISPGDELRIETLKRLVQAPDIANWLDLMRASGKAPIKRLIENFTRPNIDQGEFE